MFDFTLPAFLGNGRADKIDKHLVTSSRTEPNKQWLYLCGPDAAAQQILEVAHGRCALTPMTEKHRREFSHRLEFAGGVDAATLEMVALLTEYRILSPKNYLDFVLVMDWYKIPPGDDGNATSAWINTDAGELVHRAKYFKPPSTAKVRAMGELSGRLASAIQRHPLLATADVLLTVPGSAGDFRGFSERLAQAIVARAGKSLVWTVSVNGPRAQRKETGAADDLSGAFAIPTSLSGSALVIDDVLRSGATMSAVALAARRAGARRVYGLAAVKTMRN